jgi:hypothetical protein
MATPKALNALMVKILLYPKGDPLSTTLPQLYSYCPDYSLVIMKELAQLFVSVMNTGDPAKASPVFDCIIHMFTSIDTKRPEIKFYALFLLGRIVFNPSSNTQRK